MEPSFYDRFHHLIERQSWWLLVMVSVAMAFFVGWVDYATGWEWSLFIFYAIPIFLVTWYQGQAVGLALAVLCGAVWWAANESVNPYRTGWGFALAALTRVAYFMFVAIGTFALRARDDANRARIVALERARDLERDLVRISEYEQRRIGQDLHDSLCQNLAAIACAVRSYNDDLATGRSPDPAEGRVIEDLLKSATLEARQLARRFFPAHMEGVGLAAALQEMVHSMNRNQDIRLVFHEESEVHIADPEAAMHLFRIAQEALNNGIKHSRASQITVTLGMSGEHPKLCKLCITDNGIGPSSIRENSQSMGLKTMHYRARLLGTSLEISGPPEGGTTICCSIKPDIHLTLNDTI